MVLHNLPEGMAVGVVIAGWLTGSESISFAAALALSLGIALQNLPEGAIISMPLASNGMRRRRAFTYGVLSGAVDMIKEDVWGNKTILTRMGKNELFGETFACGEDSLSVVTFVAPYGARVLLIPFHRVMHNCANACAFHQKLIENMVKVIAGKNRELMRKIEVVSKRTIRDKLLAYLSLQAQTQDSPYFDIPLGRVELAEYLCVDRSALTRELAKMKEEGILDYDRNSFRLLQ